LSPSEDERGRLIVVAAEAAWLAGESEQTLRFARGGRRACGDVPAWRETARTQLAFRARLRRARQRVRAREELRAAYGAFDRLGATKSAGVAAAELEIALLLAEGKTTREAAAAVFLSPKTVEYHLRHVYQKLGIRSRDELAARVSP
jgi:DNA-binding CsgD family transcriptional regulator